ncbi:hypothetical protein EJ03DRAFT_328549 [Teratosphaeria nubilosa]|uniref:Zn(2)-C6 fungal-type domain-containing protein n=1 Tax=Teratosphaeria nubilosa TaxID=161662 RepID=A0A6G1L7G4_9PEZI|nr:hypothetical protein EJ03DRAFT_328549 [Teratosphaeria nubilosa]
MARISFGSRAGGGSDYLTGNGEFSYRSSTLNGMFDSLEELTAALKTEIKACTASELPELTTCELRVRDEATVPLMRPAIGPYADGGEHDLTPEFKQTWMDGSENYPGITKILPKAKIADILNTPVGQPRQIVQRAASRAFVQAIEATDGFKYSFNNAWAAKDEEGLRFSYICQDSMQNKDRHANGFHKTTKHLKGEGERGPRKPTYDCKGSISVKFSQARRCVEVYYRHYAIHSSVAERRAAKYMTPRVKKPPRTVPAPQSAPARPQVGLLQALQSEQSAYEDVSDNAMPPPQPMPPPSGNKILKRKRDLIGDKDESNMSLADLLRQSDEASKPPPSPAAKDKPRGFTVAPPVDYALPSWQAAPPMPQAVPPPTSNAQPPHPYRSTWNGTNYAPPYQPQQFHPPYGQPAPPVAIPRAAPTTVRQQYQGLPGHHPQAQGLFSTLKPVKKEDYTSYEPHFVIYHSNRAKTSCHNCRVSKKKCDEGRPRCGACARTNKLDCTYETAPNQGPKIWNPSQTPKTPSTPQQPPTPQMTDPTVASSQTLGAAQNEASQQLQDEAARAESPDPWFPKR